MKRATSIAVAAILASCGTAHAEPILLAAFDTQSSGAGAAPGEPRVEFVLELIGEQASTQLGRGVFWEEGDTGAVDMSSETEPGFDIFATLVTNGIDDILANGVFWPSGGSLFVDLESELLGAAPDLAGNELDFVRLIVRSVHFEPFHADGVSIDYDLTYELYGHAVPEPHTLGLLSAGIALGLIRRV